jgi:hypothetical protein
MQLRPRLGRLSVRRASLRVAGTWSCESGREALPKADLAAKRDETSWPRAQPSTDEPTRGVIRIHWHGTTPTIASHVADEPIEAVLPTRGFAEDRVAHTSIT